LNASDVSALIEASLHRIDLIGSMSDNFLIVPTLPLIMIAFNVKIKICLSIYHLLVDILILSKPSHISDVKNQ